MLTDLSELVQLGNLALGACKAADPRVLFAGRRHLRQHLALTLFQAVRFRFCQYNVKALVQCNVVHWERCRVSV